MMSLVVRSFLKSKNLYKNCKNSYKKLSWNSLVLFDEVMRLYLNCHTYNDKSEVNYPIYNWMPASSKSRQTSPVDFELSPQI